jgi:hypothetical protein
MHFYIENTQKTILKTRLYELICSAFSQPRLLVCSSVDCMFWGEKSTDLKSVDMSTNNEQICFFQQIVGLVQTFYLGSPLGDLNPLSSPRIEKLMIPPSLGTRSLFFASFKNRNLRKFLLKFTHPEWCFLPKFVKVYVSM